jgi:hypothetical protein
MLAIISGVGSRRAKLCITRTKTCVLSRAQSYKPLRMGLSHERVGRAPHRPMQASRGWTSHARERVAAVSTSQMGCHALRRSPRASRVGCRERAAGELRRQGHSTSSRGRERATQGAASRRGREQRARRGRAARAGCVGRGRASAEPAQGPRRAATGTPRRDGRWPSRARGRAGHAAPPRRGRALAEPGERAGEPRAATPRRPPRRARRGRERRGKGMGRRERDGLTSRDGDGAVRCGGGGSPATERWRKREASGERFARGREKNVSSWEREDEQGATTETYRRAPRGGRRRLGNCSARTRATEAGKSLGGWAASQPTCGPRAGEKRGARLGCASRRVGPRAGQPA